MIVQLINNVFDLFKVIFWNSDDPFLQYLDLCIQSRIMKTFISSVIFFPFSFSLLKFKNSSDFFILSHMFHPSYKDLDTCLHRWRRQRNKTYWEWKVQWEVTPKNQLNLLLLFMMKQFGKEGTVRTAETEMSPNNVKVQMKGASQIWLEFSIFTVSSAKNNPPFFVDPFHTFRHLPSP